MMIIFLQRLMADNGRFSAAIPHTSRTRSDIVVIIIIWAVVSTLSAFPHSKKQYKESFHSQHRYYHLLRCNHDNHHFNFHCLHHHQCQQYNHHLDCHVQARGGGWSIKSSSSPSSFTKMSSQNNHHLNCFLQARGGGRWSRLSFHISPPVRAGHPGQVKHLEI